jgi:CHAT domain-containing protein
MAGERTQDVLRFAASVGLPRRAPAPGRASPDAYRPAFWAPFTLVGNG